MILESQEVPILWRYKPQTEIAIKWHKLSNNNWRGCDRSIIEDVYETNVTFRGLESELAGLNTALGNRRTNIPATFNAGEEVFGADVDHSGTLDLVVVQYGKIRHIGFKIWEMKLTLRLPTPVFKTVTPDFTKLRTANHMDTRETEFQIRKLFTYDGVLNAADHIGNDGTDAGTFTAKFTQTKNEMPAIRRYLTSTARATKIPFPTFGGVVQPFGSRAGDLPFDCRIIKWDDLGRQDFCDWNLSMTFARDLSYWNE